MSNTVKTLIAIALVSLFPALTIYSGLQAPVQGYSQDQAVQLAEDFLEKSPTYSFDGLQGSAQYVDTNTLENHPVQYVITIEFESRQAGYGDRTGQMLAQVITPHTMVITVIEGEIVSAVTDGVYDELTGQMLPSGTAEGKPPHELEEAEEIAMEWLRNAPTYSFDGVEGSMEVIDTSIAESYPVQYFVSIRFTSRHAGYGNRTGEMLAQVITEHTAHVIVSSGNVQSAVIDGEWDEINQRENVSSDLLPPEEALEMVVYYLQENYSEAEHLTITDDWGVTDVTPENLLGSMVTEYRGDGWVITESHPVVWKPVYTFEFENLETGFKWMGSLDQSGEITEIDE